jgi:hypothetical protein
MPAAPSLSWSPRPLALPALAVAGVGPVALGLARRVLATPELPLGPWRGVAGAGVLVLLGEADTLPWVEGVLYLGRDPQAPSLLLPCTLAPSLAPALLERALVARAEGLTPLAVLPASRRLVAVGAARPLSREVLAAWCATQEAA